MVETRGKSMKGMTKYQGFKQPSTGTPGKSGALKKFERKSALNTVPNILQNRIYGTKADREAVLMKKYPERYMSQISQQTGKRAIGK